MFKLCSKYCDDVTMSVLSVVVKASFNVSNQRMNRLKLTQIFIVAFIVCYKVNYTMVHKKCATLIF